MIIRLLRQRCRQIAVAMLGLSATFAGTLAAQEADFPPFEKVSEGFKKIESKSPDGKTFCNVWTREKDGQMLIELPKDFAMKKFFIALTVSSGDDYAGLQSGDYYVYWRQYDKRLALIAPNMDIRSTGEPESKSSVKRLFTDQVMLDVPIVSMVPRGGPVIDGDALLVGQASKFFGGSVRVTNPSLVRIASAKSFSMNTEIAYEVVGNEGKLQTLHYSLSEVPESTGYKPRKADERIGYFTTGYTDLGKYDSKETKTRYINRWRLEKRDPSLKVSPPIKPIEFYIEHTTPVRYRRWVKEGAEFWNKAFEQVGFSDAIVVHYQDAQTGKYMDIDPEDVQYNFIRWLNNNVGTAIGPSRVHPLTGEILDADIVLTDGWIRHFNFQFHDMMPEIATEGMNAETLSWLAQHPNWDPRVRMASPSNREHIADTLARKRSMPFAGHPATMVDPKLLGSNQYDGLIGRISQTNGMCLAATGKQLDMAMARLGLELLLEQVNADDEPKPEGDKPAEDKKDEKPKKPAEELLDNIPESFIGPLLADLVAHEVGHTLGLRHNFKASSIYTLDQINSEEIKGKKPFTGSVMDYIPINFNLESGKVQGDWGMIGLGPYDYWAIEYGYQPDDAKLKDILSRVSEPELAYATDEDTSGSDPLARRYDFSKNPLDFAENQMRLVKLYRSRLLEKFVKDGESWARARRGYELTLGEQTKAIGMMSNWVGGAHVNRDKKGDPGNRAPIEVVPAEQQRKALEFVIASAFADDAFGLTPELLNRLSTDMWMDDGMGFLDSEATWPLHDRILNIQSSALTQLMNPIRLRRVFDNEARVPNDQDALTLPEVMEKIQGSIWSELAAEFVGEATTRKPRISSLRRSLQREHLERLIDLSMTADGGSAATKAISNLSMMQLKDLKLKLEGALGKQGLDTYSVAHLSEAQQRITKALDAAYIYNVPQPPVMNLPSFLLGRDVPAASEPQQEQ